MNQLSTTGSEFVIKLDTYIDDLVNAACSNPQLAKVPRSVVVGSVFVGLSLFYVYMIPLMLWAISLSLIIRNCSVIPQWAAIMSAILVAVNYQNFLIPIGVVYVSKELMPKSSDKPWYRFGY